MQKLADVKGLSEAKIEKMLEAARKLCAQFGWQSARQVESQVAKQPLNSPQLPELDMQQLVRVWLIISKDLRT